MMGTSLEPDSWPGGRGRRYPNLAPSRFETSPKMSEQRVQLAVNGGLDPPSRLRCIGQGQCGSTTAALCPGIRGVFPLTFSGPGAVPTIQGRGPGTLRMCPVIAVSNRKTARMLLETPRYTSNVEKAPDVTPVVDAISPSRDTLTVRRAFPGSLWWVPPPSPSKNPTTAAGGRPHHDGVTGWFRTDSM